MSREDFDRLSAGYDVLERDRHQLLDLLQRLRYNEESDCCIECGFLRGECQVEYCEIEALLDRMKR